VKYILKPCVELKDVSIYLPGQPDPVLSNLDMEIHPGEWLAVAGANGCGKSVLARLLCGLEGSYSGEIRRFKQGVREQIQLVMQNPDAQLVGDTVWEDLIFGLEARGLPAETISKKGRDALERVGLSGLLHRPVQQLSGGQKQLLALAGAIAAEPAVLVTDEATSMLDPLARERVIQVLRNLHHQGTAIVMLTQLMEETVHADRIIALSQGTISYCGGVRDFFYGPAFAGEAGYCEEAGLAPPYSVLVARSLLRQGVILQGCPATPEELIKAVITV
jgi:energy-coupling factor transport system ATP-binding protein